MSCTNPNCECKPGTYQDSTGKWTIGYANQNPPHTVAAQRAIDALLAVKPSTQAWFTEDMLDGMHWQQQVSINTATGKYRVEITWALDCYRVSVIRRVQEPEKLREVRHPHFARTAVKTANALLKHYEQNGY
jgi:hypothetical protein